MTPLEDARDAAFFGRRKGKALRAGQAERLRQLLPRLAVPLHEPAPTDLGALFRHAPTEIRLEIGFGGGEHLAHRAAERPDVGFIGVEPFVNGMVKALGLIEERGLANVRLSDRDAIAVLDWLPSASLQRIVLLYPDPWPKKRHWKRRFVGPDTLARFARVLRPGGEFHFASDIESYVDWTLFETRRVPGFRWTATRPQDWRQPWTGWPGTRYEAKAIREGRVPAYLTFRWEPDGDRMAFDEFNDTLRSRDPS
ncbi:tRNA (guanine(46)-N(7))-methyltransferase TrmB [Chthonobacter rhizosphaerae]|uniref:tRNA (guanine(46)-N(7))-methyltransferase TrmB n=1 Tax=Chthonobacter rhizosphaerae TaxID=2735553 RepID=UPI0015EF2D36|nr:tRNA (guanine(46)-N(7))-methyltransferase TrmB [Chthonobacter rhizosphaerae]